MRCTMTILTIALCCWLPGKAAYADGATAQADAVAPATAAVATPTTAAVAAPATPPDTASSNLLSTGVTGTNHETPATVQHVAMTQAESHTSSVQDLSIFVVLSLGIMGLLWVRRHTSEL